MNTAFLDDIRVLDLTRLFAGPFGGQLLGDFGADVIRVERLEGGDGARMAIPRLMNPDGSLSDEAASYLALNRNKRSITTNIASADGQQLIRDLAARSDVFLENYKVGDLARYGLDYASIKKVNPKIIYCSVTGFGQTGPDADQPGTDPVFQARSGWTSVTGHPDTVENGGPLLAGIYVADIFGGSFLAMGVLAALRLRDRTGVGQHIDLSLLDVAVATTSHAAQEYLVSGEQKERLGWRMAAVVPGGIMPCRDGSIVAIPSTQDQVKIFLDILGIPERFEDPRFSTMVSRIHNRAELEPEIFALTAQWTKADLTRALHQAHVPVSPLNDFAEVFADPQVIARNLVHELDHPISGKVKILTNPIKFSETPIDSYRRPPMRGEHTDEVLNEVLGLSPQRIAELRASGVI